MVLGASIRICNRTNILPEFCVISLFVFIISSHLYAFFNDVRCGVSCFWLSSHRILQFHMAVFHSFSLCFDPSVLVCAPVLICIALLCSTEWICQHLFSHSTEEGQLGFFSCFCYWERHCYECSHCFRVHVSRRFFRVKLGQVCLGHGTWSFPSWPGHAMHFPT